MIGKESISAIIIDATDEEMAALALAENIDREDLTAYEIAVSIRNAEASFPSRKSLATCLGIARTELYQYLAFFKLPDFVIADLELAPSLLGRDAAEDIARVISKHGQPALDTLAKVWLRVKSGDIDQGKVAGLVEAAILRGEKAAVTRDRDIRKLFVGKVQAGSITRDEKGLVIRIHATALNSGREAELREFVEHLLSEPEKQTE